MTRKLGFVLGFGVLVSAAPVFAHHSISAEFDTTKTITFTGTVKAIEWGSPHIYTQIETKDEATGKMRVYRVEGQPPNTLYRAGWRKDTLKIGETVTVSGNPAKSASSTNVGQASIKTKDGKEVFKGNGPAQ